MICVKRLRLDGSCFLRLVLIVWVKMGVVFLVLMVMVIGLWFIIVGVMNMLFCKLFMIFISVLLVWVIWVIWVFLVLFLFVL